MIQSLTPLYYNTMHAAVAFKITTRIMIITVCWAYNIKGLYKTLMYWLDVCLSCDDITSDHVRAIISPHYNYEMHKMLVY